MDRERIGGRRFPAPHDGGPAGRYRRLALMIPVVALVAAGCAGPDDPNTIVGHGVDRFPSESLTDWVSYANHVSVFTVVDERQLAMGEHEEEHGEGMVGRSVTVRIEETLWQHERTQRIDQEFSYATDGWILKEGDTHPFALAGGTRVEVGERYLAAWVHTAEDGWFPLASSTIMPVASAGLPTRSAHGNTMPANGALVGLSLAQVSTLLDQTSPDPVAAQYADLPPEPRLNAVLLSELPQRAGLVPAVIGSANGSFGYVAEADWNAIAETGDDTVEIPFYNVDGERDGTFSLRTGQVLTG